MQKLLTLALTLLCIFTNLIACNNNYIDKPEVTVYLESCTDTMVVIKATAVTTGSTALNLLEKVQENGELVFEAIDGGYGAYVTSINGKSEVVNGNEGFSWMLYTSDEKLSSTEFGSVVYNGVTYGQAAVGASSLTAKAGEYYIWVYEGWSF